MEAVPKYGYSGMKRVRLYSTVDPESHERRGLGRQVVVREEQRVVRVEEMDEDAVVLRQGFRVGTDVESVRDLDRASDRSARLVQLDARA